MRLLNDIVAAFRLLDQGLRRWFWWLVVVAAVASAFEASGVIIAFELIQLTLDPDKQDGLPVIGRLLQFLSVDMTNTVLIYAAVLMAVFFLLKNIFLVFASYTQFHFTNTAALRMAHDLLSKYLYCPFEDISRRNSADLYINIRQSTYMVSDRILHTSVIIFTELLVVAGIISVLLYTEPNISIMVGLILVSVMGLYYAFVQSLFRRWGKKQLQYEKTVNQNIHENVNSLKDIMIHGCQPFFLDKFYRNQRKLARVLTSTGVTSTIPRFFTELILVVAIALVISIVFLEERPNREILETLGLFAFAGFRLMPAVNRLTTSLTTIRYGHSALDSVLTDLNELGSNKPVRQSSPPLTPLSFTENLRGSGIGFGYPGSLEEVLKDVSLAIEPGQFIGIVGPSGAGKTTLINVLLGLLHAKKGTFHLGTESVDLGSEAWRGLLGYIPQEISLIDDTIRRNIAFGVPDEEIDEQRVLRSIRLAAIGDVIGDLPDGLDAIIGEQGSSLSGGQRQRIGIARALYRNPRILFMDEATSALDSETERRIIDALCELAGEVTVIVIAHRLATVQHCDLLIYMEAGRIVDIGTFDQIRSRNESFDKQVKLAKITETATM